MKQSTKLFLFVKALIIILIVTAGIAPATSGQSIPPTIFSGEVIGNNLEGKYIEYYINHNEQRLTIPIVEQGDRFTYSVIVPMNGVPTGSTITFKIDEQTYGFGDLDGTTQKLDLQQDERG